MAEERDNRVTLYGVMSPWPALLYAPRSRAVFDDRASLRLVLRACCCQPLKGCASGLHVPGATEAEYTVTWSISLKNENSVIYKVVTY